MTVTRRRGRTRATALHPRRRATRPVVRAACASTVETAHTPLKSQDGIRAGSQDVSPLPRERPSGAAPPRAPEPLSGEPERERGCGGERVGSGLFPKRQSRWPVRARLPREGPPTYAEYGLQFLPCGPSRLGPQREGRTGQWPPTCHPSNTSAPPTGRGVCRHGKRAFPQSRGHICGAGPRTLPPRR